MDVFKNPYRGGATQPDIPSFIPFPSDDAETPQALLSRCPTAAETPLVDAQELAVAANVSKVWVKDERARMGIGSFKALGAAYVVAHEAAKSGSDDLSTALEGTTFVTASAGNHGMSVAAGAKVFGAKSAVYLASPVPESFAERLREKGAQVVRAGEIYEDSMNAALDAARDNGWTLLSDTSWDEYYEIPHRLMEGYLVFMAEAARQIDGPPTHIFLQAGVGGLACAAAAFARKTWGDGPIISVVEPETAPALVASIKAGKSIVADGPVSHMGRLDCKEPSLVAFKGLARDADFFITITEDESTVETEKMTPMGLETSTSGSAGAVAMVLAGPHRDTLGMDQNSKVLLILSEGPA